MKAFARWRALLRNVFRREKIDCELDQELASYLELTGDEAAAAGMNPEAARRHARLRLGGVASVTESVRQGRAGASIERLAQDIRYAARGIRRAPGHAMAMAMTFGLGLGLGTGVFAVVYGILLRPLPIHSPDEIVGLYRTDARHGETRGHVTGARLRAWREQNTVFSGVVGATREELFVLAGDRALRVDAELVSIDFFSMLGATAMRGRLFGAHDVATAGGEVPCVIAETLWRKEFGADPAVPGRTLIANGLRFSVVGVVPDGFARWRQPAELWAPYAATPTLLQPEILDSDGYSIFRVFARLKPGVTLTAAGSAMTVLNQSIGQQLHRGDGLEEGVATVAARQAAIDPGVRRSLLVLSATTVLVLLLTVANLTSLTVSRRARRAREFATRLALGGSRSRLVAMLTAEGVVLAALGVSIGVPLAFWVLEALVALAPPEATRGAVIAIDTWALLCAAAIGTTSVLVASIGAAFFAAGPAAGSLRLRADATPSLRAAGIQSVLVGVQSVVAVPLVVGAGVLISSVAALNRVDLGFDPRGLELMRISLPSAGYRTGEAVVRLQDRLLENAAGQSSLASLAVSNGMPVSYYATAPPIAGVSITLETGRKILNGNPDDAWYAPGRQHVSTTYFEVMGIPVRRGRTFVASDRAGAPLVAVVNETMAARLWPGENPVGKHINFELAQGRRPLTAPWTEIVGVVADVRHFRFDAAARPHVYVPLAQIGYGQPWLFVHARPRTTEAEAAAALRRIVAASDSGLPIEAIRSAGEVLDELTATPRYTATLLEVFGVGALVLAAVGIYGLGALALSRRMREIGIRLALGATSWDVVRRMVFVGLKPAAAGIAIGVLVARLTVTLLRGLAFGITPDDAVIFALAVVTLITVAAIAAYLPARRAARIDPVQTLRAE